MQNGSLYRKLLNSSRYIKDLPDYALDHLMFGHEKRIGVLRAEIFLLRNELKNVESFIVPHLKEILCEKEELHSILKLEK